MMNGANATEENRSNEAGTTNENIVLPVAAQG